MRKLLILTVVMAFVSLTGCIGGSGNQPPPKPTSFTVGPDFSSLESCGRPCWLPVYAKPQNMKGLSVTQNWPCEYYLKTTETTACSGKDSTASDQLVAVCQIKGQKLTDDAGNSSGVWDRVLVPKVHLTGNIAATRSLKPASGGSYAYAADIWLGNKGWRSKPCPK